MTNVASDKKAEKELTEAERRELNKRMAEWWGIG